MATATSTHFAQVHYKGHSGQRCSVHERHSKLPKDIHRLTLTVFVAYVIYREAEEGSLVTEAVSFDSLSWCKLPPVQLEYSLSMAYMAPTKKGLPSQQIKQITCDKSQTAGISGAQSAKPDAGTSSWRARSCQGNPRSQSCTRILNSKTVE
jgi:hypothetical protein